jgi:Protein of unknown function (DUF3179)
MMLARRSLLRAIGAAGLVGALPEILAAKDSEEFYLIRDAVFGAATERQTALAAISSRGLPDLAAGLILGMRFTDNGEAEVTPVLRAITGEARASNWFDWMIWQERHPDVVPHESYAALMRELYLRIDPNFDVFLKPRDLRRDRARIRIEEIVWGGVTKDGIPSLDNPDLIAAAEADYMRGDDLVFGVSINGDVRAYPLRIMGWHEMFNDVIGGVPLALAYCTLCGSGILFETLVAGRSGALTFGSSGFLYRSNKLMYDKGTNTLWNQFTGEPVVGRLADSGIVLKQRPVVITDWASWARANPQTQVLSLDTGFRRDYGSGVVYQDYFASPDLMFPAASDQSKHRQKDYVFGIRQFGGAKAWPVDAFRRHPVINDTVAGVPVVLFGDASTRTVRAYERGDLTFRQKRGAVSSADGAVWTLTEDALAAPDGRTLPRVAGHIAYWFAWNGYLGAESELYAE